MTIFAHSHTTNKLVNEAANDSSQVSGQDRKIPPALGTQSDCRFWRIPPTRKLGKKQRYLLMKLWSGSDVKVFLCRTTFKFNPIRVNKNT